MLIKPITAADFADWLKLRKQLWSTTAESGHKRQMQQILDQPAKLVAFMAYHNNIAVAFAEASLRYDYVAGCSTSPVVYLEGMFVIAEERKQGIAKLLCGAIEDWGKANGCTELASDVEITNLLSQQVHQSLKFQEVERVVCYYKKIG